MQIGGCDDNNFTAFSRVSPSWVTGRVVKMQVFKKGIIRRRWGGEAKVGTPEQAQSYLHASWLTALLLVNHLAVLLKQQVG